MLIRLILLENTDRAFSVDRANTSPGAIEEESIAFACGSNPLF